MGIQLWMPRQTLPNAAESLWLADGKAEQAQVETAGASMQAGHAADLLAGMDLAKVVEAQVSAATVTKTVAAKDIVTAERVAQDTSAEDVAPTEMTLVDLTVPEFELHFVLWPCGILWVAGQAFDQGDHGFQASVSYALLGNSVPQASFSQFKWPYIEGSSEDQSISVALRALTAQWEFMSGQGARGWVAMDASSYEWLSKVAVKPLFSVDEREELYCTLGKKQLWQALQALPKNIVS